MAAAPIRSFMEPLLPGTGSLASSVTFDQQARFSVHPLKISVKVRLQAKRLSNIVPQCATLSVSRYPGLVMSQLPVRAGMCLLSRVPGLLADIPRRP